MDEAPNGASNPAALIGACHTRLQAFTIIGQAVEDCKCAASDIVELDILGLHEKTPWGQLNGSGAGKYPVFELRLTPRIRLVAKPPDTPFFGESRPSHITVVFYQKCPKVCIPILNWH